MCPHTVQIDLQSTTACLRENIRICQTPGCAFFYDISYSTTTFGVGAGDASASSNIHRHSKLKFSVKNITIVVGELLRFGFVGIAATLLYVVLSAIFIYANIAPVIASAASYIICMFASYLGHRFLTFRSTHSSSKEFGKFAVVTFAGLLTSTCVMAATLRLGLDASLGVLAVVVSIPIVNFVIFKVWVFNQSLSDEASNQHD